MSNTQKIQDRSPHNCTLFLNKLGLKPLLKELFSNPQKIYKDSNYRTYLLLAAALVFVSTLLVFSTNFNTPSKKSYFDPYRDYSSMPFDIIDATSACQHQIRERYGKNLVRSNIDNHSTRFEDKEQIYKVFLFAAVGNNYESEEVFVHCFVDPAKYMVSHFRSFGSKQDSLMKKALNFFNEKKS